MRKTLRSSAKETARRRLPEAVAGSVHAEDPTTATGFEAELAELKRLSLDDLRLRWRNNWGRLAPVHLSRGLLFRVMAYRLQAEAFGDLDRKTVRLLEQMANDAVAKMAAKVATTPGSNERAQSRISSARAAYEPLVLKPGALLIREWQGKLERVTVVDPGSPGTAQLMRACRLSPSPSPARSGTATASSACGVEIASERASTTVIRIGSIEVRGQVRWRMASRTTCLSRRRVRHRLR